MRQEQSHRSWLLGEAARLDEQACRLECEADEAEAYSIGSFLMGGSSASGRSVDESRVERMRDEARDKRALALTYRGKVRQRHGA